MFMFDVAEIRERGFNDSVMLLYQRQTWLDLAAVRSLLFQIPLAFIGCRSAIFILPPAEPNRTHRHG